MAGRSPAPGILREITRGDLSLGAANSIVRKTGFKALGSYNWLDKPEPTILVPGMDLHLSLDVLPSILNLLPLSNTKQI